MRAQKKAPGDPDYDPKVYDDEYPPHLVELDAYRIARYPVTVGHYAAFVKDGGYDQARWWAAGGHGRFPAPADWETQCRTSNCPVTGVSWWEAMAWCAWQDGQRRRTGDDQGQVRLPSEAEWERAARGGDGRRWPWGGQGPNAEHANYAMNIGRPTPVGIYPAGAPPDGVQDLVGNVWEWCLDGFDDDWYQKCQQQSLVDNPVRAGDASSRVLRGGGFENGAGNLRATFRNGGFRCVLGPRRQP